MPHATAADGVKLYFEEAGDGVPILFAHEFAGDYRSWEAQMRFFSRRHRCITYSARGYPESDIPDDVTAYGQDQARDDIVAILDHLKIDRAYIVGLSMGAYATLQVGLSHPDRTRGLVLASGGSGSEPDQVDEFRAACMDMAEQYETHGSEAIAAGYGHGPTRVQFQNKNPRGFAEFVAWFGAHSPVGSAHTMRGFQAGRRSLWTYQAELNALRTPTLVIAGDEDEPCLRPALYLKRQIPTAGLAILPRTGHCVAQEEPALFNALMADFIAQAEAGEWTARDPRAEMLPMPGVDA